MTGNLKSISSFFMALVVGLVLLTACGDASTTVGLATTSAAIPAATTAPAGTTSGASTTVSGVTTAPAVSTTVASAATTAGATTAGAISTTAASPATGGVGAATCTKINLNNFTDAQVTSTIPNFPNQMLREFKEYAPYASIAVFRKEMGKYVNAAQVTEWEKYVFVPVKPNESDVETLKQIPGVDNTIATALSAGRPYASNAAFLQALAAKVSAPQAAAASCYLGA